MKKISLFGLIAALAVGSLVWMGCEGAATPSVNNYYTGGPVDNNGLGDEDTLYLQYRPEIGYSVVTSLGTLQLELFAPSKSSSGLPVDAIVYAGTGETLNYEITVPDGKKLFIGYKISETATVGSLAIGAKGSIVVGDGLGPNGSALDAAALYIAYAEGNPYTGAVTLAKSGSITVSGQTNGETDIVTGALTLATDEVAAASDVWDDLAGTGASYFIYTGADKVENGAVDLSLKTIIVTGAYFDTTGDVGDLTVFGNVSADGATISKAAITGDVTLDGSVIEEGYIIGKVTSYGTTGFKAGSITGDVLIDSGTLTLSEDSAVTVTGSVEALGALVGDDNDTTVTGDVLVDTALTQNITGTLTIGGMLVLCDGDVTATGAITALGGISVNDGTKAHADFFKAAPSTTAQSIILVGESSLDDGAKITAAFNTAPYITRTGSATLSLSAEGSVGSIKIGEGAYTGIGVTLTGGADDDEELELEVGGTAILTISDGGYIKFGTVTTISNIGEAAGTFAATNGVTSIAANGEIAVATELTLNARAKTQTTLKSTAADTVTVGLSILTWYKSWVPARCSWTMTR